MPRRRNAMWRACQELQSLMDDMRLRRAQLVAERLNGDVVQEPPKLRTAPRTAADRPLRRHKPSRA